MFTKNILLQLFKLKFMLRYIECIFITLVILFSFQTQVFSLTNEPIFSQFQFNFITPGARATALGGAFIGLADDATAVETNPAGLTALSAPEVSAEFKHITYTSEQLYANPFSLESINIETGVIESDIERKEFTSSVESVPFLSLVYPYKRFVFSFYRQESIRYKMSYRTSKFEIMVPGTFDRAFSPKDEAVDLTVTNYGIGIACQLFENFSLALSPRWSEMSLRSHSYTFEKENTSGFTEFTDDEIFIKSNIDDEDIQYSINAGILWGPHKKISMGLAYRYGPTFTLERTTVGMLKDTIVSEYKPELSEFTLKIPDSFGIGIAFRFTEFLTMSLDIVHIRYEDLLEDFDLVFGADTFGTKENYAVDNITEVHVGMEYILPFDERLLAIRAGAYHEPDHVIRFTGTTGDPATDMAMKELYPTGEDQLHITGGLGLVISERFQIDTAADIASRSAQFSFSSVFRF